MTRHLARLASSAVITVLAALPWLALAVVVAITTPNPERDP